MVQSGGIVSANANLGLWQISVNEGAAAEGGNTIAMFEDRL